MYEHREIIWRVVLIALVISSPFITVRSVPAQGSQTSSPKDSTAAPNPGNAATQPTPDPSPENIWTRDNLTGNWKKKWEERGVKLDLSWTNYFQGTAAGGLEQRFGYGANLIGEMELDTTKLGWWKMGKFKIKVDNRYGDSVSEFTGAIQPVNTGLFTPKESGTATSVTAFNYTHIFPLFKPGDMVLVSLGRFDTLDLIVEPLIAGAGLHKFMNINQNAPLTEARNVPLVTWGASAAWVRKGEPFFTIAFLDSADSSTNTGLKHLFAKGVTIMPSLIYVTHFGGKAGHQSIRASYSDQLATPFDRLRQVILPGPDRFVEKKNGSWAVTYSFDQYFHEIPGYPRKGWGLFGQASFADPKTSPVSAFFQIGLGGNSPFKNRPRDLFGVVYAFDKISPDLKNALLLLNRLRDEHEFEAFYNFSLTPWLYVTGDLQLVRPARPAADFAVVPGARLRVVF